MVCNSKECHVAIRERKRERERQSERWKKKLNENASCDGRANLRLFILKILTWDLEY